MLKSVSQNCIKPAQSLRVKPIFRQYQHKSNMAVNAENIAYVKGFGKQLGIVRFAIELCQLLKPKNYNIKKELIDFANKPQWITDKYGGTVPVFKFGEEIVPDSGAIAEYLEKIIPDPTTKPNPSTAEVGSKFLPSFVQFLTSKGDEVSQKQQAFEGQLKEIDEALGKVSGPFFGGDHLNDTDASLAPKLLRHAVTALKFFRGYEFLSKYQNISKYYYSVTERPEWKNTFYSDEAVIAGWKNKVDQS